jgi:hypothetical protein
MKGGLNYTGLPAMRLTGRQLKNYMEKPSGDTEIKILRASGFCCRECWFGGKGLFRHWRFNQLPGNLLLPPPGDKRNQQLLRLTANAKYADAI